MAITTLTRFNSYDSFYARPSDEMVTIINAKLDELINQGVIPAGAANNWTPEFRTVEGYSRPIKYSRRIWPNQELAEMWVSYMTENNAVECFIEVTND